MRALELTTTAGAGQLQVAAARIAERHAVVSLAAMTPDQVRSLLAHECPAVVGVLDAVSSELESNGLALVRDIPTTSDAFLVVMCQFIGRLDAATERPRSFIEHIAPSDAIDTSRRPHSQRRTALMPHTDQSARGNPPDYLALACVTNAAETGGESVLVPIEPIALHLAESDPPTYELLQDAEFPIFNVPKRDFAVTAPLLTVRGQAGPADPHRRHEVRFRDEAIRAGLREMNRPSDAHVRAFERLSTEIHDEKWWLVHRLRPGEVIFFDNKRVLHGRRAIVAEHDRDLKRLNGRYWAAPVDRHSMALSCP